MAGRANIAKERVLASKDRSDIEGMVILPARFLRVIEGWILVSVLNMFLMHVLVSRLYPKQEHKQGTTINHGGMHKHHDAIHVMICEM